MKKRNLNSKNLRLLSVGLLTSSAVLSVSDVQPVVAKEIEDQITSGSEEEESVEILSSTKEHETTESTIEEIEYSSSTENSTTSSTDDPTEETSSESSNSSDDPSSTQEPTDSTSTSETNTSTTDTTTSTTSSSTDSSTTSTTTAPSKPKPSKPKPKPKPSKPKPKPSKPKPAPSKPNLPVQGPIQQPSVPTPQPSRPMPNPTVGTVTGNTASGTSTGGSDQVFHISPNLTTKSFVKVIGEDARSIAGENNLYASVMIAQAILESASGNSALASAPNYNLFGIKGSYEGASANFLTSEDNGSGSMFTIRSNFRKYPSYKESLGDYVKLLRGGTDASSGFYSGTWKSNTKSYKDATKFLTGRYATDTSYNSKLNGLIDAYDLTQYDTLKDKKKTKKAKKITLNTSFDKLEKKEDKKDQNIEYLTHIVKKGESLKSISELYNISTLAILEKNQLDRRMLFIGQKLSVPKQEEKVTTVAKEDAVDRSLNMVQKLSNAFNDQETSQTNVKKVAKTTSSAKKEATTKKEAKEYKVSATRKKTKETYEVKKGDTLASISKKTGISVWSLKEWNDLDQYFLTEGQQLILAPVYDLQS